MPIFFIASILGFFFPLFFFPCFCRRMVENKFNKWDNRLSQVLVPCSVGDFCNTRYHSTRFFLVTAENLKMPFLVAILIGFGLATPSLTSCPEYRRWQDMTSGRSSPTRSDFFSLQFGEAMGCIDNFSCTARPNQQETWNYQIRSMGVYRIRTSGAWPWAVYQLQMITGAYVMHECGVLDHM